MKNLWNSIAETVKNAAYDAGSTLNRMGNTVGEAVSSAGKVISETASSVSHSAVQFADQNGDGKFDQEDVLIILDSIYKNSVNGIPNVSKPVSEFSEEYLKHATDSKEAARKMIDNSVIKCTTSGFMTGFGGAITLPVTLPANITSVLYIQLRMIASIAYMAGLDVQSDATQTLVYACLAGVSVAEVVKKAGIQIGMKLSKTMVQKIPGKALQAINRKVGFRLLTKFGSKGVINIGKMIPIVGAVIGGGFDLAETKIIANRAYKEFMESDFYINDESGEMETVSMISEEENEVESNGEV